MLKVYALICLQDVENSRSYIDVLYSTDYVEIQDALITLKNAVIGSNKQKGSFISQGLLPKLISFITQDDVPLNIKLDAAIVIGKNDFKSRCVYRTIVLM